MGFLSPRFAAVVAVAATLAWCAWFEHPLRDGDSALYAAMAHEIAAEGTWLAPQWAFGGEAVPFRENPPFALWLPALLELVGLDSGQAARVANAFWLFVLLAATARFAQAEPSVAPLATGILLLHLPVLHYLQRASLEMPFAAVFVVCLAAQRAKGKRARTCAALAFGAALLTRGVFALALPPLLLLDALLAPPSRQRAGHQLAVTLLGGIGIAAAFDLAHASVTGSSFWAAYLDGQVLASFDAEGTPHPNTGSTWLYYLGRLLLYSLPWGAIAFWRGMSRWKRIHPDQVLALAWIALFYVGASLAQREGSRYLFAAWPAVALLTARTLSGWWRARREETRRALWAVSLLLVPVLTIGKSLSAPRDPWWHAAEALHALRENSTVLQPRPVIYGDFAPHDDRTKQFLRHHLGVWAFRLPDDGALLHEPAWRCRLAGAPESAAGEEAILSTVLFSLTRIDPVAAPPE